jgi:spermidine synthase
LGKLVHVEDSAYGEIRVIDALEDRHLVLDGGLHTIVDVPSGVPMHRYVHAVCLTRFLFPRPGRGLVVGLGGGSVVDELYRGGWTVEAVEIDPKVVRVARQHFNLRAEAAQVVVADGRRYLRDRAGPYDLVVLDAFGSSSIPFHLVTREFFALVASRLAPGGIVALNVEAIGWEDVLVRSVAATLRTQFAHVIALPTGEPPSALGNVVLLASQRAMELPEAALRQPFDHLADPSTHFAVVQENHAWENRYAPNAEGATILTDDRNPADLWSERVNRAARRQLHEYFAKRAASW